MTINQLRTILANTQLPGSARVMFTFSRKKRTDIVPIESWGDMKGAEDEPLFFVSMDAPDGKRRRGPISD